MGALFVGGIWALGTTAANAATTTGDDGLLSGTQVGAVVEAPVSALGNAVSVLGDSSSTAAPAAAPAAPAPAAPVAAAPAASTAAAAPAATSPAAAQPAGNNAAVATGQNVNKFTGALGAPPTPIINSGGARPFSGASASTLLS